jgi:flagellar biosynthesis regulator FlaF
MIIENLKLVLSNTQVDLLRSEENKLHYEMQKQLIQMSNFADGTVLREIDRINKHISEKFNIECDC